MVIEYPYSVDYFVHLLFEKRQWVAAIFVMLCEAFQIKWAKIVVPFLFIVLELLARINDSAKHPSVPLPRLGENDVAIVTGGSKGLGLELVKSLTTNYKVRKVYVLDIQKPSTDLGGTVHFIQCDLSSSEAVESALDDISARCKKDNFPVSVLVNNAGIRINGSLLSMSKTSIQQVFDVNTFSPVTILRRIVSDYIKNRADRRLSIVTVSSVLGSLGPRNLSAYSASKAAIAQFHEVLSRELVDFPAIRMLLVMPGQLTTEMFGDVEPSRKFVAPLVDHVALAELILERVNLGTKGVMCEPFYANFGPLFNVLPWKLQQMARKFSQIDEKVSG